MPDLNRSLYAYDNLEVLNDPLALPNDSVDLIYLDPPFNYPTESTTSNKKHTATPKQMRRSPSEPTKQDAPIADDWDIPKLNNSDAERLEYPTQKPLALLERIISMSSNPGDLVLNPFCGCGTTVHAAEKLGRRWIDIDISRFSTGLIRERLLNNIPTLYDAGQYPLIQGYPIEHLLQRKPLNLPTYRLRDDARLT